MTNLEHVRSLIRQGLSREANSHGARAADDSLFAEFRARTGLELPDEMVAILRDFNGVRIGAAGLYGVCPDQEFTDIEATYKLFPGWKDCCWIPVGGDGCGNYYVLLGNAPGRPVGFIDTLEDPNAIAYLVASGYWVFIEFYLGEASGEELWPFDRDYVLENDPELARCEDAPMPWDFC